MKRVYAVATGLALVLTPAVVPAGLASAAPLSSAQSIEYVVQRALSQRGVPFVYGGGNASGPTGGASQRASTSPGRYPGTATIPGTPAIPAAPGLPGTATLPGISPVPTPGVVGFDASGLVQYAFAGVGIKLPRTSGEQCNVGRKVPPAQARRGDLMCYGPGGSQSVAIYLGNGQMIEATEPAVTVSAARTSNMTPYLTRIIE
ncbi:NlpC/P60 family peptidoglycan-binding protein RipD [Mycobacterium shimoidei]|uniref:Putative invasion protein [Mycobacterium tuberculosis H37Rv] n=1 Tax=Mycobacterium shimoidei TaxID=29313 RepID=A0A1E3TE04_MYCSH|nr:NlpC/P60 family peptidoglycan-binding protein RipD [Mycobacterium shimoidei]MCV7260332.1 NlpC/P60 family peptidoglycan-binding protein RipD [Mycobacterium shimoidei]ODR12594.1 hydrolase [Mycobacterium shimoidei]ORW82174.1 hydrolase [Mycobacterium shimoidei]SRX95402.1 putative invasion protein [Mycobacterium tuberculosis H37Rv] [Mycobacterium shimoidei]